MKKLLKNLYIQAHIFIYKYTFVVGTKLGLNRGSRLIVCYHNIGYDTDPYTISPEEFTLQLHNYLQEYKVVSLSEILKPTSDSQNLLCITFDDGYQGVYTQALPIMKKLGITGTAFVLSRPNKADRQQLDNQLPLMTWSQVKKLASANWEIGCHSATHTDFNHAGIDKLRTEIVTAKAELEKHLGMTVSWFACPKGISNPRIQKLIKQAGYAAGFGIQARLVDERQNSLNIPRLILDRSIEAQEFPAYTSRTSLWLRSLTDQLALGRLRWG